MEWYEHNGGQSGMQTSCIQDQLDEFSADPAAPTEMEAWEGMTTPRKSTYEWLSFIRVIQSGTGASWWTCKITTPGTATSILQLS